MNAIIGFSDLLSPLIEDPRQREYLGSISSSGRALLHLINDILDLSKVEAGKMQIVPTAFVPERLFREIGQIFSQRVGEKGIGFELVVDPRLPKTIILDQVRLRQVLLNLVGNAVKFTEEGCVRLVASCLAPSDGGRSRCSVELRIEDTGIGIPDREKGRIFEAFEQIPNQDQAKYGGTGLGLAICRKLLKLMNGELRVEDNPQGRGSVFVVTLDDVPVAACLLEQRSGEGGGEDRYRLQPATVLVVDDIELNRKLLIAYLQSQPLTFLQAGDGCQALGIMREFRPDLVITDIKMPGMGGDELAREAAADPALASIPILAVTASAMPSQLASMKGLFASLLFKPVLKEELLAEMAKLIPCEEGGGQGSPEPALRCDRNLSCLDPEGLRAALSACDEEYRVLKTTLQVNKVRQFCDRIAGFSERFGAPALGFWAHNLEGALASFDVARIRAEMNRLEEVAAVLRDDEG